MSDEDITTSAALDFDPVPVRHRHDGWTVERQIDFVAALAEGGCVAEAARSVGMSVESAYALRRRADARSLRRAWTAALDLAMRRLSDSVISRAINGVAVPHFYKGEKVGEHRRYNDRLAMFLLRYRDPLHAERSEAETDRRIDVFAIRFAAASMDLENELLEKEFAPNPADAGAHDDAGRSPRTPPDVP